jgi:hypothetical protein
VNAARRSFVRAENVRLGRFLDVEHLVGWRRSYRCPCGFTCNAPGEIFDHTEKCSHEVAS